MQGKENKQLIIKNTIMLYIRMFILIIVNLYTSRVVLNALGVDDYGIYSAVGGFVSMFTMISTSLSGAISRYLTFSLAKDSIKRVNEVFSSSLIIQFFLCALLLLLGETVGIWFLNSKMIIPAERLCAANWVFQLSILTAMINLLSVPYNSLLIAHEKMSTFAYIGIFEGFSYLLISLLINYSPIDSLVFYSLLMCFVAILIRLFYGNYCLRHFPESKFKYIYDKTLLKEMFGFAGWNFIGSSSGVLRSQGINLLINLFCGPAVNAARGIAMQVNTAVSNFSMNFTTAIRPQITKSYAIGDHNTYEDLVFKCSKFSFYILMIICIPLLIESNFIIHLWLVEVPEYTIDFVCVILLLTMIESYSNSLIYLLLATGKIKKYQLLVGSIQLLNFPFAYILLDYGFNPVSTVASVIFIAVICLGLRLYLLYNMMNFPIYKFIMNIILKTLCVFVLSLFCSYFISSKNISNGWNSFVINIIITEFICLILIYKLGITKSERRYLKDKILTFIKY